MGKNKEALEYAKQALDIRQCLKLKSPDRYEPDYAMSLDNYASHLSDVGKNEEALEHAKQALDIRQHLKLKNPDRHEPDYAMSLDNYASHLSDAGKYEEALEYTKQALEIRQRLKLKNPDRYELDYSWSLDNYASHMSDAGKYEEALAHAKQALDISQRLKLKNPVRFAEDWFSNDCHTRILKWLDGHVKGGDELNSIPEAIPPYRRPLLLFNKAFVQACLAAEDRAVLADAFKQVTTLWGDLSQANRTTAQDYWLCAVAWCVTHESSLVEGLDWQANYQQYINQRNGRLPHWMQEVARRLEFQWPDQVMLAK